MFIYALACQASIISAFMSTCFLVGLYAKRDRLQQKILYTHIPLRLGRLKEVKETTEFSGITLSPVSALLPTGTLEIMQMSGCANVRYLIHSMHNWWGQRRRERIIEARFVNSWELLCSAFDEQKDFQGWFSYAANTERGTHALEGHREPRAEPKQAINSLRLTHYWPARFHLRSTMSDTGLVVKVKPLEMWCVL